MLDNSNVKSVLVMLSTYNGERFLRKQLDSIINQEDVCVYLLIRDDGSTDNTLHILDEYWSLYPHMITIYRGTNIGCVQSFRFLMEKADTFTLFLPDFYAFCDQDDIWVNEKLKRATKALTVYDQSIPNLFFSHFKKIDEWENELFTEKKEFKLSFGESLIMNPSVGCTQVFNRICLEKSLMCNPPQLVLHDWWIYSLCLALSGNVIYDSDALVLYRQHSSNVLGAQHISRFRKLYNWLLKKNNNLCMHLAESLYNGYKDQMNSKNKNLVKLCLEYRKNIYYRLKLLVSISKFKTINRDVNCGFILSVLFGKF